MCRAHGLSGTWALGLPGTRAHGLFDTTLTLQPPSNIADTEDYLLQGAHRVKQKVHEL
jgi:hypothetical protein